MKEVLDSLEEGVIDVPFDVGTDDGKTVNMKSKNRIKFVVSRNRFR